MGVAVDAGRIVSGSSANDFCLKTNQATDILIAPNGSIGLRITSAGTVGINTHNPTFAAGGGVHLKGSGTDFTSYRVTASSNTGVDFSQASDGKGYVYNRDNADLIVGTNNTERLRIVSDGNITFTGPDTSYATIMYAGNYTKLDLRGTNIANSNHYMLSYGAGHGLSLIHI